MHLRPILTQLSEKVTKIFTESATLTCYTEYTEKEPEENLLLAQNTASKLREAIETGESLRASLDKYYNQYVELMNSLGPEEYGQEEVHYQSLLNTHYIPTTLVNTQEELSRLKSEYDLNIGLIEMLKRKMSVNVAIESSNVSRSHSPASFTNQTRRPQPLKLGPVEKITFSGNVLDYPAFREAMKVIDASDNSTYAKFLYLKQSTKGIAFDAIKSLTLTESNYQLAKDLLEKHFGSDDLLVDSLLKSLQNLPAPTRTAGSLQRYYFELESILQQLQNQEVHTDDGILRNMITQKLPDQILERIIRRRHKIKEENKVWNTDALMKEFYKAKANKYHRRLWWR
ncbi:unnamed protein product [Bursaphelenchus xylophilus]|uniref:(pine wood nematode) hypothetical protein n=1 Tax=Bursaphelenchus xylophilus TaxID=6326 RepID=A0A7I8WMJ9_BURXY|nr:unnamed protein product [Bursaphelenchus xylophilus]CAG9104232.1 unnamed protein product [Bursaphelenchus xylophilus]